MSKWVTVSAKDLTDAPSPRRDPHDIKLAKGALPSRKIDWMVDNLEKIIPQLQAQGELERLSAINLE